MAINLDDHAVFIDRLQMDMVPLSVAKQAVQEVIDNMDTKVEQAMNLIEKSLAEINKNLEVND